MRTPLVLALILIAIPTARADEPAGPKDAVGDNRADEPKIAAFSQEAAVAFLDRAALDWTKKRECFSCHTNFAFLYARPIVSAKAPAHDEVRKSLEDLVTVRWK